MAAVDEIAIKLGIKTGDLKAALLDAGAEVKKFKKAGESGPDEGLMGQLKGIKKGFKDFHDLLAAGGVATAVQQFFSLAIDRAEELKSSSNENAAAVRRFAEGIKEAKNVFADFAVAAIGITNRVGEAWGGLITLATAFVKNGKEGVETWRAAENAAVQTAEGARQAEDNLAKARKLHGEEFLSITRTLADLEKKSDEQKLKGLTTLETQANQQAQLNQLIAEMATGEGDAITRRRLAVDIAKTQLALDETNLQVAKDAVAEEKRLDEAAADRFFTAEDEAAKMRERKALDQKEELEIFTLQQKRADQLTADEKKRLEVLMLQRAEKAKQVEIDDLLKKKIEEGLTPEETKLLNQLIKQTAEVQKQIADKTQIVDVVANEQLPTEAEVTEELRKQSQELTRQNTLAESYIDQWNEFTVGMQTEGDARTLTQTQLAALQSRLRSDLQAAQEADRTVGGVGIMPGTYKGLAQLQAQLNLEIVNREVELRRDFESTVRRFGMEAAERTFNPDVYNRLSGIFNSDLLKQQARDISSMNRTLANVFPKQAQGIFPTT